MSKLSNILASLRAQIQIDWTIKKLPDEIITRLGKMTEELEYETMMHLNTFNK